MSTLAALSAVITERVRDAAGKLSPAAIETGLLAALEEYSRDVPRDIVVQVTGTAGFDYAVSGFGAAESGSTASTQWSAGFSQITEVVYPYSASERYMPTLEPDQYQVVRLPAGETLRFLSYTPSLAELFLVHFTRPHEVNVRVGTVPTADEQAVCSLAAAFALESLAAVYAQATDGSLTADIVDHRGRTNVYLDLARNYRRQYYAHVGRKQNGDATSSAAAGANVDLDRGYRGNGPSHLFYGRRVT